MVWYLGFFVVLGLWKGCILGMRVYFYRYCSLICFGVDCSDFRLFKFFDYGRSK